MEIVLRAVVVYLFLWALTRAMGRKELSELSSFELILLVIMGDLVQQGVTQEDMSVTGAVLAVGTMALLVVATSYVAYRWKPARSVVEGMPVIVVRDGEPLPEVLEIERLTTEELRDAAREQGIKDLRDIELGVLEPDGKYSFLRASAAAPGRGRRHRA